MLKIQRFTIRRPILFGFLLILFFAVLSTLTWPITQIETTPTGYEVGSALAKLVIAACFVLILWGFGWSRTAGLTNLGSRKIWFLVSVLIIYRAVFGVYGFTGSFQFSLPEPEMVGAILFYTFTTSLSEETMYRGLLLTVMVKAWGSSRRGVYSAALFSGLFWAANHLFNLIVRPFPVVAAQVFETTLSGFVYAAIVLSGRSIWPAVALHWAINAAINLTVSQNPNFSETTTAWLIFNLVSLPTILAGVYLMQKVNLTNGGKEINHE